jgi:hypothetical protein
LPHFSQRQGLFYNIKSISSIPFLIFSKEIYKKIPKANYSIHEKPFIQADLIHFKITQKLKIFQRKIEYSKEFFPKSRFYS